MALKYTLYTSGSLSFPLIQEGHIPLSILHKSIAGRYRPVRVADGPIMARCRFTKNASWAVSGERMCTSTGKLRIRPTQEKMWSGKLTALDLTLMGRLARKTSKKKTKKKKKKKKKPKTNPLTVHSYCFFFLFFTTFTLNIEHLNSLS